jgi:hypothetical protein
VEAGSAVRTGDRVGSAAKGGEGRFEAFDERAGREPAAVEALVDIGLLVARENRVGYGDEFRMTVVFQAKLPRYASGPVG